MLQVGAPQALNCYDVHRSSLKQFLKEQSKTIRTEKQLLLAVFSLGKSSQVPTPTGWQLSKQPGVLSSCAVVLLRRCFVYFFWKSKQTGAYRFRKLISIQYIATAVLVILLGVFNAICWIHWRRFFIINLKIIIKTKNAATKHEEFLINHVQFHVLYERKIFQNLCL